MTTFHTFLNKCYDKAQHHLNLVIYNIYVWRTNKMASKSSLRIIHVVLFCSTCFLLINVLDYLWATTKLPTSNNIRLMCWVWDDYFLKKKDNFTQTVMAYFNDITNIICVVFSQDCSCFAECKHMQKVSVNVLLLICSCFLKSRVQNRDCSTYFVYKGHLIYTVKNEVLRMLLPILYKSPG